MPKKSMKKAAKPKAKGAALAHKPRKSVARTQAAPKASVQIRAGRAAKGSRPAASQHIDDWRAATLAVVRRLIHEADPEVVEERKWVKPTNPQGVPVWSREGIVCTGEIYREVVKLTFARGASLKDPSRLFNSSLDGNTRRAIDILKGEALDADAFKKLIQAAVEENLRSSAGKSKSHPKAKPAGRAKLLSGGNPQIKMGYGDGPVQEYIDAMSGWKREIGKRLDALIVLNLPEVRKAVKWNSPFYGIEGQGWFLSFHCFDKYVKVCFFRGTSLRPLPPGESKQKEVRYIDLHEHDDVDDAQFVDWVKQASRLPGERM